MTPIIWTILGTLCSAASVAYAVYLHFETLKVKRASKVWLETLAGQIEYAIVSANWAVTHFNVINEIRDRLNGDETDLAKLRISAGHGSSDATSVQRLLETALTTSLGAQEAQFDTREIKHVGMKSSEDGAVLTIGGILTEFQRMRKLTPSDENTAKDFRALLAHMQNHGIHTLKDLREMIGSRKVHECLLKLANTELLRNGNLDLFLYGYHGTYLHSRRCSKTSIDHTRNEFKRSDEYTAKHP